MRNQFEGDELQPAMVSAIIQNSFSPNYPLQAGSDIIGRIPTSSLSNLSFQLVDANFYPIKLLSPLYLTSSVNEVLDPSEDLTPFIDKLPKNRPTSEQAQQIAQAEEAQKQEAEEYFTRGMQTILENQKQQELLQAQQQQYLAQQQAYELAQAGIDINALQSVGGEVE
jgi:transcription termination factor NusB